MLNPLQPGVDGVVAQFAHRLMRGQANVEFVGGRHHSSLTTGLDNSSILRPAAASSALRCTTSFNAASRCICTACTMSCGSVFSSSLTVVLTGGSFCRIGTRLAGRLDGLRGCGANYCGDRTIVLIVTLLPLVIRASHVPALLRVSNPVIAFWIEAVPVE